MMGMDFPDDAIIEEAFQQAFGRDGLGAAPWVEGDVIVCPGATIAKSRTSHRSRFISVDDTWVWDSMDLIVEEKKSHPGKDEGFKAVALVPVIEGMALDLVTIKGRNGVLNVERVVSYEVQRGELIEVSARAIELRNLLAGPLRFELLGSGVAVGRTLSAGESLRNKITARGL